MKSKIRKRIKSKSKRRSEIARHALDQRQRHPIMKSYSYSYSCS
jgi:hypothetical protein